MWPTEIESDLSLYHDRDIADWWNGDMSSRWLWVRIAHLPDDSATKTAMRDGDWSESQYIYARLANELMYFRADHAAIHARQRMTPQPIESPRQRAERAEQDAARKQIGDTLRAQLRGEYIPAPREVAFEIVDTPAKGGTHG